MASCSPHRAPAVRQNAARRLLVTRSVQKVLGGKIVYAAGRLANRAQRHTVRHVNFEQAVQAPQGTAYRPFPSLWP